MSRRRAVIWTCVVVVLVPVAVWLRHSHILAWLISSGAIAAGIGAIVSGVESAVNLFGRRPRSLEQSRQDAAAEKLAKAIRRQLQAERKLRQLHDPWPLPIRWVPSRRPVSDHWQAIWGVPGCDEPIDLSGELDEIARVFAAVPSRRLVVLGGSGAGKTILGQHLAFALLDPDQRQVTDPVPVVLPLSSWDPTQIGLREWIARWLGENYDVLRARARTSRTVAHELVATGRVLPVLDGLDEMPQPLRVAALVLLNRELTRDDPLVLTCRPDEYEAAVSAPDGDVLTAAAVVELCPLDPEDLRNYLGTATKPTRIGKWDPVFADLDQHPDGPLAQALSTPLMAWLARIAYGETTAEPADLLTVGYGGRRLYGTRERVQERLLDQLISAVYTPHPDAPSRHRWAVHNAQRWLQFLAAHLKRLDTTDLAWWRLQEAISTVVFGALFGALCGSVTFLTDKYLNIPVDPLRTGLVTGLAVAFVAGLTRPVGSARQPSGRLASGKAFLRRFALGFAVAWPLGLPFPLVSGAAAGFARSAWPARIRIRFRGAAGAFALRFVVGFVIGAAIGFAWSYLAVSDLTMRNNLLLGLACGSALGLAGAFTGWFSVATDVARVTRPIDTLRRDRAATWWFGLVFSLFGGLLIAALMMQLLRHTGLADVFGLMTTTAIGVTVVVATVAVLGLLFGLTLVFVIVVTSTWGIFFIARVWLALTRRIPWRLMGFLDDAYRLGILRQVGGVYQFRHIQLRDRLARRAEAEAEVDDDSVLRSVPVWRARLRTVFPAWARVLSGTLAALVLFALLVFDPGEILSATDRPAQPGAGYVWVSNPGAPLSGLSYRDNYGDYGYSSAKEGLVLVRREETGVHDVVFVGLDASGGVPQASAYGNTAGDTSAFCALGEWGSDGVSQLVRVRVLCFSRSGQPVDVRFMVSFANRSQGSGRFSYLVNDQPDAARTYHPDVSLRYDSPGRTNRIASVTRHGTGRYQVYVPASESVPADEQFYQVTVIGAPAHCKLSAPPSSSGKQEIVCWDVHGHPADTQFALTFSARTSIVGRADLGHGYRFFPHARQDRQEPGWYTLTLPGLGADHSQVAVSPIGDSDVYCQVAWWDWDGPNLLVGVRCWSSSSGTLAAIDLAVGVTS